MENTINIYEINSKILELSINIFLTDNKSNLLGLEEKIENVNIIFDKLKQKVYTLNDIEFETI